MNFNFEQLIRRAKALSLMREEKLRIHKNLVHFMERYPVRIGVDARHIDTRSPLSAFIIKLRMVAIGLIIALLAGGGVSYAAEGTLPGDTLYPVKVSINENVRGLLALGDESKAKWESRLAERRLEEAEKLAAKGSFDTHTRAEVETRFNAHAERAQKHIESLRADGDADTAVRVSSQFETSLRVHERILGELGVRKSAARSEIEEVKTDIRAHVEAITNARKSAEAGFAAKAETQTETSAASALQAAENKMREVRSHIENMRTRLGTEATTQADIQMTVASKTLADAKAKFEAKMYNEAFVLAHKTVRLAQEAKLLLDAKQHLDIDVKIHGLNMMKEKVKTEAPQAPEATTESEMELEMQMKMETDARPENTGNEIRGESRLEVELEL